MRRNFRGIKYNPSNKARFKFNEITSIKMDLAKKPGSERSNIIPYGGVNKSDPPTVTVFGSPGASFEVEFRETDLMVLTGGSGGNFRSGGYTTPTDISKNDGLIPNTPAGIIKIPASGKYTFKFPPLAKLPDSDVWKEFDMKFIARKNTVIRDSAKESYSSLKFGESENAILTNRLYQYPPSNITISATKDASWNYVTNYNISDIEDFGKRGGVSIGRPYLKTSKMRSVVDSVKNIKFELRVTKGGTFSFTNKVKTIYLADGKTVSHYTVNPDVFVPNVENNDDKVIFPKLRVHIGNGLSSTDNDYATVIGRIKYVQFGKQPQDYNIDLTKIFNHV